MSPKKARQEKLLLTHRALSELTDIESYSRQNWGRRAADKYLNEIEVSLQLIQEDAGILRPLEGFHEALRYYRVNKHLLVCDVQPRSIVVLTVIHGSMDLPSRLAELLPQLTNEVALLHDQLAASKRHR